MSITVMERVTSRPLINDPRAMSVSREYWAQSTDPQEDVGNINDAVANSAPDFYLGMIKRRIKCDPLGGGFWHCVVEYGQLEGQTLAGQGSQTPSSSSPGFGPDDKLGPEVSFSTAGGTEHITQSFGTVGEAGYAGRSPPETNNAINVSKNGVAGCDIAVPKLEWQTTRRVEFVTQAYINKLVDCTGSVNNVSWNSFDHHCALFLGADGKSNAQVGDDYWLVTYKFLIGRNRTDIVIRPWTDPATPRLGLIVASKFAHDFLWVGYEPAVDETAGAILQVPWFAKVERVYKETNFRELLGF